MLPAPANRVSVRTVGISPRTSFPTVRYLPAAVLQVWDALPFFPPDAGITISTLRVDDIRLCRTISTPAAWTIFASLGSQTTKPRNHFGFGASFTLAAIYSRGTCRPTTIDVLMFHFRVRNGTGWDHQAMTTRFQSYGLACSSLLRNS